MENQDKNIDLTISFEDKSTEIKGLLLSLCPNGLQLAKQKCKIAVPWTNITTLAKNKQCLLLWVNDPARRPPEESWDEQEPEQEHQQTVQQKKMDSLLFNMLLEVQKGKTFQNTLKGSFSLQISFSSLNFLQLAQQTIEKGIRDIEQSLQSKGMMMEEEGFEVGLEEEL